MRPVTGQVDDLLGRDQAARREGRARAGDHADQAHGGGSHRVLRRARRPSALPALGHRHPGAHRHLARPASGRVRRAGRDQPLARGPGLAGGEPGRDPRRGQGRFLTQRALADPDHRPRCAQRSRPGLHVRGPHHDRDEVRNRRDRRAAGSCRRATTRSTASPRRRFGAPSWTSTRPAARRTTTRCRARRALQPRVAPGPSRRPRTSTTSWWTASRRYASRCLWRPRTSSSRRPPGSATICTDFRPGCPSRCARRSPPPPATRFATPEGVQRWQVPAAGRGRKGGRPSSPPGKRRS